MHPLAFVGLIHTFFRNLEQASRTLALETAKFTLAQRHVPSRTNNSCTGANERSHTKAYPLGIARRAVKGKSFVVGPLLLPWLWEEGSTFVNTWICLATCNG